MAIDSDLKWQTGWSAMPVVVRLGGAIANMTDVSIGIGDGLAVLKAELGLAVA